MVLLVAMAAAAVLVSCGDRVTERTSTVASDSVYASENAVQGWIGLDRCVDALEFANWVKKKYPQIWREYYSETSGGTSGVGTTPLRENGK